MCGLLYRDARRDYVLGLCVASIAQLSVAGSVVDNTRGESACHSSIQLGQRENVNESVNENVDQQLSCQ